MRRILALCFAAMTAMSNSASADSPVVVELFTSQGCSACPPADELLHELVQRDDVIALALHVDYWDYIGWKDEFADPKHTARQRQYALEAGRRSVYTPQMIVNGQAAIIGTKPMKLIDHITKYADDPSPIDLTVTRSGADIQISADATGVSDSLIVHMVYFTPERSVDIKRGENAGKSFTYANVAQGWKILAEWNAATPLRMNAVARYELPVVVMVQQGRVGPILAAREVR